MKKELLKMNSVFFRHAGMYRCFRCSYFNLRLLAIRFISFTQSSFRRNIFPARDMFTHPQTKLFNLGLCDGSWKLHSRACCIFKESTRSRCLWSESRLRGEQFSQFFYRATVVDKIVACDPSPSKFVIYDDKNI